MSVNKSVKLIRSKSKGRRPKVGIILGSGLGFFADIVENKLSFSYDDLPGFPKAGVAGHAGQLTLGQKVYAYNGGIVTGSVADYASGEFVRVLGYCVDSGNTNGSASIYFNPDNTWIEIA